MYALFFLTCLTGAAECYQPDGYVYPDSFNCEADKHQRGLGKLYVCLPIEGVIANDNSLPRVSGE
ncbi:Phage protein [Sodalis praecaptivus]|uniref:Phage protein n=1 Tax=Sodalis praecaptivus TaxID=1239307 RepID=W0HW13_9GAMM|nr:Phage protein [Sodalis praecaptivus]